MSLPCLAGGALLAAAAVTPGRAEDAAHVLSVVRIEAPKTRLAFGDVDGDGRRDLCRVEDGGLAVHRQDEGGAFAAEPDALFAWPADHMAWTVEDVDGDGTIELAGFVEAREVRTWRLDGDGPELGEGRLELEATGHLPRGRYRMRFLRDVDRDGRLDLVLPAFGSYAVHRRAADGGWAAPLEVRLEAEIDYEVGDPAQLDSRFGQEVDVPWFRLEDVDGDGDADLVAETEDAVYFHLAEPLVTSEPTWTLDLAALRSELEEPGEVDFDDLLASVGARVAWRLADLDGAVPRDLVLQLGSKFRVHLGGARSGPAGVPDQVLKSSGNVLGFLLRDVQGDARVDLQLIRGERISLARVLRWLIFPGGLDFELFTYENAGGTFSLRPTRRNTLELKFPRLLSFVQEIEGIEERARSEHVPARRVALDPDGLADDVADVVAGELLLHHERVEPEEPTPDGKALLDFIDTALFPELDALPDGGTKTIDLSELEDWTLSPGAALRAACRGAEPEERIALAPGTRRAEVRQLDLDADGTNDLLVLGKEDESEAWVLQILVRRP